MSPVPDFISREVFTVEGLFAPRRCDELIQWSEGQGYTDAPITTAGGPVMAPDIRNNHRVMVDDVELAEELWEAIRDYVPLKLRGGTAMGVNERLRFYRYDVGQRFNWHYDGYFARHEKQRSQLTYMIYLNDGFEGGETMFREVATGERTPSVAIAPRQGMALVFAHQLLHKGETVVSGQKYVVRTDVMYRWD